MTVRSKALLWAAIIISAAIICVAINLNTGASFGVIGGLSGAALGSLQPDGLCRGECLQ